MYAYSWDGKDFRGGYRTVDAALMAAGNERCGIYNPTPDGDDYSIVKIAEITYAKDLLPARGLNVVDLILESAEEVLSARIESNDTILRLDRSDGEELERLIVQFLIQRGHFGGLYAINPGTVQSHQLHAKD